MRILKHIVHLTIPMAMLAIVLTATATHAQTAAFDSGNERQQINKYIDANSKLNAKQLQLKEHLGNVVSEELLKQASSPREAAPSDYATDGSANTPHLQISLLTCGPGNEVYEYYGHSAIRVVRTDSTGLDLTFNYGVFDFNTSFFALKFAMGETYYMCVGQPTEDFIAYYRHSGRYIDEQILNLTQNECRRIYQALLNNIKPENRTYLYNVLYDNCATRVRDIIEQNLDGELQYPNRPTERSFRDAIHFFCRNAKWSSFSQDLLLGAKADLPATGRELQFAPLVLEQDIDHTLILAEGYSVHNFVLKKHRLLDTDTTITPSAGFPVSPSALAALVLIASIIIGVWEVGHRRIIWPIDTMLLLIQGTAGIIVSFVFFFSEHPTVDSNWLIWILNPLPLAGLYWQITGARKNNYKQYHAIAAPTIALFLLCSKSIPQHFDSAIILLALLMLIRSLTNIVVWLKSRKAAQA